MATYIERETLLEKIGDEYDLNYGEILADPQKFFGMVEDFPAADVAPVVHGRWEPVMEGVWNLPTPICVGWSCSLCGRYEQYKEPYCNCGAHMEDGE